MAAENNQMSNVVKCAINSAIDAVYEHDVGLRHTVQLRAKMMSVNNDITLLQALGPRTRLDP